MTEYVDWNTANERCQSAEGQSSTRPEESAHLATMRTKSMWDTAAIRIKGSFNDGACLHYVQIMLGGGWGS